MCVYMYVGDECIRVCIQARDVKKVYELMRMIVEKQNESCKGVTVR